jgi:FdhD protein
MTLPGHLQPHLESHPVGAPTIGGVTGVILAGGGSTRMGSNKALLPYRGGVFIEAIFRQLQRLFAEVLLVTNHPEQYQFLPCRKVADIYAGCGALAGIHSALYHSCSDAVFVVACDMPYLNPALVELIAGKDTTADVVMPRSDSGLEPLHALYTKRCLPAIEASLQQGRRRLISFLPSVKVQEIPPSVVATLDPLNSSFSNINTPEQYHRLRDSENNRRKDAPTACPLQLRAAR